MRINPRTRNILAGSALAVATAVGCSEDRPIASISADPTKSTPSAQTDGTNGGTTECKTLAVCSDGQALAIALTANQGEIDVATAVIDRLRDADLKAFAQEMINDHTKLRDAIAAAAATPPADNVGKRNRTTPPEAVTPIVAQPNAISAKLQQETRRTIAELATLPDDQLDASYLLTELLDHLTTVALMDHVVVPSISNVNLAMVIASGGPVVKLHELQASQLQTRLLGACGGAITTPAEDGGTPRADAGPATEDAGPATEDAGPATEDAGPATTEDAGDLDAGTEIDPGVMDVPAFRRRR